MSEDTEFFRSLGFLLAVARSSDGAASRLAAGHLRARRYWDQAAVDQVEREGALGQMFTEYVVKCAMLMTAPSIIGGADGEISFHVRRPG